MLLKVSASGLRLYEKYSYILGHPNNNTCSLLIPIIIELPKNEFIIVNEVDGRSLADSQTEIVFAHNTEDGWIPGITDRQLLAILCERFKKDSKKVEILRTLMNS